MAYTRSKAQAAKGFVLNINTGTASSPTWTPVGENFKTDPAMKWETDEATNFASSGTEFIQTMFDGGEWKFSANRVTTDTGQAAVESAFYAGGLEQFTIVAPLATGQTSVGDTWSFYALVTDFNPSFDPKKKIPMSGALRTSNGVTFTRGS